MPRDWTGWRIYRARLIGAAILTALAVLGVAGVAKSAADSRRHSALEKRATVSTATVVRSSYDPSGGDPGGWTTDQIRFTDRGGHVINATVGHHYDNTLERASGKLSIVYDSSHPSNVTSVLAYRDDAAGGYVLISFTFATVFVVLAAGLWIAAPRFNVMSDRAPHGHGPPKRSAT